MEKTCVKCGYTHTHENIDSLAECPRCGVIYAKAESRADTIKQEDKQEADEQEDKQETESSSARGRSIINFLILGGIVCLFLYFYFGSNPLQKHEKQVVQQAIVQEDKPNPTSTVQKRPSPENVDLARAEEEVFEEEEEIPKVEEVIPEIPESDVSDYEERPPSTITQKVTTGYYLAESTISHGEEVILNEHMSDRRFTVFFFYADW